MVNMDELYETARKAAEKAYSPYSGFRVGAALVADDGTIFIGVNVENRSYGLTICAERSAVMAAVSAGYRRFLAIAIATPDSVAPVGPCGACRQVLSEFMEADALVRFGGSDPARVDVTIASLLPHDSLHDLGRKT